MTVVRKLDLDAVGQVTILAPREAPWRTRASVPKGLRERVVVIPDDGPGARAQAFAAGRIGLVSTPDDLAGSSAREAMACGLAPIVPRCAEADALIRHGTEGLALAPFSRDLWTATVSDLAGDAGRREALGAHASARAASRSWDIVAEELEGLYADARAGGQRRGRAGPRSHPGRPAYSPRARAAPRELVEACVARGIGAVAFIGESGPDAGVEAARIARSRLLVISGPVGAHARRRPRRVSSCAPPSRTGSGSRRPPTRSTGRAGWCWCRIRSGRSRRARIFCAATGGCSTASSR